MKHLVLVHRNGLMVVQPLRLQHLGQVPLSPVDFFSFARLFWNQILSWFSESPSSTQRCLRLSSVRYRLPVNSARSLFSCSGENAVLGLLSSSLQLAAAWLDPAVCSLFGFRGFLILRPSFPAAKKTQPPPAPPAKKA